MQGLEFGRALNRIVNDLRFNDLSTLLSRFFDPNAQNFPVDAEMRKQFSEILWDIEHSVVILKEDKNTAEVLDAIKIGGILDRQTRTLLLSAFQVNSHKDTLLGNRMFWYIYHGIWATLNLQKGFDKLVIEPKVAPSLGEVETIELNIDDYGGEPLSVARLNMILENLEELYDTVSRFLEVDAGFATIAYADSGTSFTIALKGGAKSIRAIGSLFGNAWRAVRFRKNERIERNLETLRDQLDLVADVRKRVENKELDAEDGNRIEHIVVEDMMELMGAGVLPAQIEMAEAYDRVEVLRAVRDTKLLTSGDSTEGVH